MPRSILLNSAHGLVALALVWMCCWPFAQAAMASPVRDAQTAVTAKKPDLPCITISLKDPKDTRCFADLTAGSMASKLSLLNLSALNKRLRQDGLSKSQRLSTLSQLGNMSPKKIYDQAKVARSDVIKGAIAACAVGALVGAALAFVGSIIGGNLSWIGVLTGSILGCIGPSIVQPVGKEATRRLANSWKFRN